jgi:hypothetical protein
MVQIHDMTGSTTAPKPVWSFGAYVLVYWLGIVLFLLFDVADGQSFSGDTDDLLRALEVRRFLATGAWYDMSIPDVRMPDIYVSPWSRLVDLPYALIAVALSPLTGIERALELAFLVWPPAMALFYGWLSVAILRRLAPSASDLPLSILLAVLLMSVYAIWEFSPGRIDHHNVQILLLLGLAYGIARWDRLGGALAGIFIPASVAVGLETLPVLAMAILALTVAWALGWRGGREMLRVTGLACAIASVVFALAQIAPAELLTAHNDAWSAPYVLALLAFGVLACVVPIFVRRDVPGFLGLVILAAPGAACLGGIVLAYPGLLDGPFPMISGLAKTYWFDRIHQERGALTFLETQDYRSIVLLVVSAATAGAASIGVVARARRGEPNIAALCAIAWAALLMVLVSNRFLRIELSLVPLLLPVAIVNLRALFRRSRPLAMAITASAAALGSAMLALSATVPWQTSDYDAFDQFIMNDCRSSSFAALSAIEPGRVITPPALGLQILHRQVPGISVSAISFHRSAPAMSDGLALYMTSDKSIRAGLLDGADYLALCHSPVVLRGGDQLPLFSALLKGEAVPGIVPAARSGDLMLFRIDHAAIR